MDANMNVNFIYLTQNFIFLNFCESFITKDTVIC
jgi:hypothetical protein